MLFICGRMEKPLSLKLPNDVSFKKKKGNSKMDFNKDDKERVSVLKVFRKRLKSPNTGKYAICNTVSSCKAAEPNKMNPSQGSLFLPKHISSESNNEVKTGPQKAKSKLKRRKTRSERDKTRMSGNQSAKLKYERIRDGGQAVITQSRLTVGTLSSQVQKGFGLFNRKKASDTASRGLDIDMDLHHTKENQSPNLQVGNLSSTKLHSVESDHLSVSSQPMNDAQINISMHQNMPSCDVHPASPNSDISLKSSVRAPTDVQTSKTESTPSSLTGSPDMEVLSKIPLSNLDTTKHFPGRDLSKKKKVPTATLR